MKKAVDLFEEMLDISQYVKADYMGEEVSDDIVNGLNVICAGSAYVFDKLFAKEGAGAEITELAKENHIGASFNPAALPEMAKGILQDIDGGEFFKGKSAFRDYLNCLHESDESIEEACKDDEGLFVMAVCDRIAELLNKSAGEDTIMKTCEYVFLNISNVIFNYYKLIYGPLLKKKSSASYFQALQDNFQTSREQNEI